LGEIACTHVKRVRGNPDHVMVSECWRSCLGVMTG
jgi:hypothetical protein